MREDAEQIHAGSEYAGLAQHPDPGSVMRPFHHADFPSVPSSRPVFPFETPPVQANPSETSATQAHCHHIVIGRLWLFHR